MSPHVLVHADHGDPVQAVFVAYQTLHSLGQDRVVRAIPGAVQRHGHAPDAHRVQRHRGERPPHGRLSQPPPARAHTRQIILPRAAAHPAPVATAADQQMDPGLAQRHMDEPTPTRAAHRRGNPATRTGPRRLNGLAANLPHAPGRHTAHDAGPCPSNPGNPTPATRSRRTCQTRSRAAGHLRSSSSQPTIMPHGSPHHTYKDRKSH